MVTSLRSSRARMGAGEKEQKGLQGRANFRGGNSRRNLRDGSRDGLKGIFARDPGGAPESRFCAVVERGQEGRTAHLANEASQQLGDRVSFNVAKLKVKEVKVVAHVSLRPRAGEGNHSDLR
jgi:hypothetical protein